MTNLFEKRDRWGNGISLWMFAGMVFALPLVAWALSQIRMTNDVESWLPKHDREARVLAWFKDSFPAEDRVLVTWEGSSMADPRVNQLVQKLDGVVEADGVRRHGSPFVKSTDTAESLCRKMIDYGVEPQEAVRRLTGTLIGNGFIKVRLSKAGLAQRTSTISKLKSLVAAEMGISVEILEPLKPAASPGESAVEDSFGETSLASLNVTPANDPELTKGDELPRLVPPPHDFRVKWPGMEPWSEEITEFCRLASLIKGGPTASEPHGIPLIEDCFQSPGSPVSMLVTLSEAGRADEVGAADAIRAAALSVGIPAEKLRMGGRAITASELNEAVKNSFWNKSTTSWWPHQKSVMLMTAAVGLCLAFVFLRSLRLGILVLAVSYYSTALAAALVPLAGDSMNMVLMVMPTLLNVLALSGAIHVANYWKHAAMENPQTAIKRAIEMARQPCALASITTAIGLISLLTSDLGPVRQFGLYSAVGCLIALVMVLWVLPALLQLWPADQPRAQDADARIWQRLAGVLSRHAALVTCGCLLLFAVSTYGLVYFKTETKVIRYFPPNARVVRDCKAIEQSLAGISSIETVVRFDAEMQKNTSFLERLEVVRAVGQTIREHPEISGAISLADFQPITELPPEDASTFTKIRYNRRDSETERRIKSSEETGTESFLTVAKTNSELAQGEDDELSRPGDELWRVTAQAGMISDSNFHAIIEDIDARVRSVIDQHPGTHHVVTGTVPLFLRTQLAVLDSLINSFGLAFAIIAVVMIGQLRSIPAGLLSMAPNLMPVGTVFGLLAWSGERIDVGAMVTASVALGIAVDGTLHLLTWFQDGIRKGLSRREAVAASLSHCGPAMWQTSAAVGLTLLMLFPAELLMISRFGWLMSALIGAALFADLVFLPALLTGPLGLLIERTIRKEAVKPAETPSSSPSLPDALSSSPPHFGLSKRRSRRKTYQR